MNNRRLVYLRGDVLKVSFPDKKHPVKTIQKQRNVLRSNNAQNVLILGRDADGFYIVIQCDTKRKPNSIRILVGNRSLYAYPMPLFRIDHGVLVPTEVVQLHNKQQVLQEIAQIQNKLSAAFSRPKAVTLTADDVSRLLVHEEPIIANTIFPSRENLVCPRCYRLLPTGREYVQIPHKGILLLRVGLCEKCLSYYTYDTDLREIDGTANGFPVCWSNVRYLSGDGDNIQYRKIYSPGYTRYQVDSGPENKSNSTSNYNLSPITPKEEKVAEKVNLPQKRIECKSAKIETIGINGYEIVPLDYLDRKSFKRRIILADYVCNECLECNNALIKYENFIQISDSKGIRVLGKFCTKCNSFYEERGSALKNLQTQGCVFDHYSLNSEYLIPHYSQKMRLAQTIQSAAFAIHLNCKKTKANRLITIVSEKTDRNHDQDIFHYSDWFARQLIFSVYKEKKIVNISGEIYSILKVLRLDWKNESFLDQLKIDTIVLRAGGGLYSGIHQCGTELVDILLYSPFTDCFEIAHATYDTENEIYYMDSKVFRSFVKKYGNPGIKIAAYEGGFRDFTTMREESILHAYGYVVGVTNGVSERIRRELLGEVIDLGIMSVVNIVRLLEHNISMHPQDKYKYARMDWEADKQFVMEYKVNPDRFVVATIGLA